MPRDLKWKFSHVTRIDCMTASHLPLCKPWEGIVLATVGDKEDAALIHSMFGRWKAVIVVLAVPRCTLRFQQHGWLK